MLALILILLLGSAAVVQSTWAFRSASQRSLWRVPFFMSAGISVLVASSDIYEMMASMVRGWKAEEARNMSQEPGTRRDGIRFRLTYSFPFFIR